MALEFWFEFASTYSYPAAMRQASVTAPSILADAQTPESKTLLREQTVQAQQRGIFGAPSFLVHGELFWGNDRLEDALEWHMRASRQGAPSGRATRGR